jgi:hypothetical protein
MQQNETTSIYAFVVLVSYMVLCKPMFSYHGIIRLRKDYQVLESNALQGVPGVGIDEIVETDFV